MLFMQGEREQNLEGTEAGRQEFMHREKAKTREGKESDEWSTSDALVEEGMSVTPGRQTRRYPFSRS